MMNLNGYASPNPSFKNGTISYVIGAGNPETGYDSSIQQYVNLLKNIANVRWWSIEIAAANYDNSDDAITFSLGEHNNLIWAKIFGSPFSSYLCVGVGIDSANHCVTFNGNNNNISLQGNQGGVTVLIQGGQISEMEI